MYFYVRGHFEFSNYIRLRIREVVNSEVLVKLNSEKKGKGKQVLVKFIHACFTGLLSLPTPKKKTLPRKGSNFVPQ
jgi:hypothetical protein